MNRAWCLLRPEGRALVGVPTGNDKICFNSHRVYGKFLYPRLFSYWKEIFSEVDPNVYDRETNCRSPDQNSYQPIHILEKYTFS